MSGKIIIRHAVLQDLEMISELENTCFPKSEAAFKKDLYNRIQVFPENFWLMEQDGRIISMINGMVSDIPNLLDDMYENANMHNKSGAWQMIFSVVTHPDFQNKGYAGHLMNQVIQDSVKANRKGIILTCKEKLISFYEKFGFVNEGISASVHGNTVWYQMRKNFF
ncbi:MAG: GNAT family N-acetyltransferase [Ruminococcus flavefaciens]|nr:GNAT family N-acetyltransferase [Ruminococcus flavefaciens]